MHYKALGISGKKKGNFLKRNFYFKIVKIGLWFRKTPTPQRADDKKKITPYGRS